MWVIMSVCTTSRCQSELAPCCLIDVHRLLRCRPTRWLCDSGRCTFLFCKQQDSILAHVEALTSTYNCPRVVFGNTDTFVFDRIGGRNCEISKLLHLPLSKYVDCSAWNDYWINELGKFGWKRFVSCFKVLLRHSPGEIEENHEKPQPRWPAFQPGIEPGVSELPVMNITS